MKGLGQAGNLSAERESEIFVSQFSSLMLVLENVEVVSQMRLPNEQMKFWLLGACVIIFSLLSFMIYYHSLPTMDKESLPLNGKMIFLDPGHGGPDGGAVSKSGLIEKHVTLQIAKYLRDYLQESGAVVVMSRDKDQDLAAVGTKKLSKRKKEDLYNRVKMIKNKRADVVVSIHLNAFTRSNYTGAQTFYNPVREANQKLAQSIQSEMIRVLENTNRLPKMKNDIYILKESPSTTALVEVGFLSNSQEAELLGTEKYQKKLAAAIYYGLIGYYGGKKPNSLHNVVTWQPTTRLH